TMGVPPSGCTPSRVVLIVATWAGTSGKTGRAGVDVAPQMSSLLKNAIPALVLGGKAVMASFSACLITSHLDGFAGSILTGFISQAWEVVMGGRLQFMLPLRSMRNRMFAGSKSDLMVDDAHPPSNEPVPVPVPVFCPLVKPPPAPLPPPDPEVIAFGLLAEHVTRAEEDTIMTSARDEACSVRMAAPLTVRSRSRSRSPIRRRSGLPLSRSTCR